MVSLFIFRRDLRLDDNTGLIKALKQSDEVLPCFIFDKRQIGKNPYKSTNAIQLMIESLQDLETQLTRKKGKLYYFFGIAEKIVEEIIKKIQIKAVFINYDYTPFSIKRDLEIKKICFKHNIEFNSYHDLLLTKPEETLKKDGTPYRIFSPFYKKASLIKIAKPQKNTFKNYYTKPINFSFEPKNILQNTNNSIFVKGGRKNALKILKNITKFKNYKKERDFPFIDKTTHLSAYLKFGCISAREAYHTIEPSNKTLTRQLYWRDFFTHIAYHFPHVFKGSFIKKYDEIKWENSKKLFKKWCNGETGFPIIDAGMRQLNKTGWIHNRIRMIISSFLVKDLHIDWQWGEKYFAQKLVDYDPCVNNGNWQWIAGTGTDAQPYFRIFNPWLQQKRYDPQAKYIKKWVYELKEIKSSIIHKQNSFYLKPIIDHKLEAKKSKIIYKNI